MRFAGEGRPEGVLSLRRKPERTRREINGVKRSRIEQETVILYNEAEQTAQVFTFDRRLLRKLKALIKKYPGQVRQLEDHRYAVPKQCIQVREPYSEERKRKLSEKMKAAGIRPPTRSPGNSQGTGNDEEIYGKGDEKA